MTMIENRELTMDDYLAMLRRRLKVILIPALLAPIVGFAASYAFKSKFTSTSLVLVEEQKVPEGYVKPAITEDLGQRVATLQQRALGADRLRPLIDQLQLAKGGRTVDDVMDDIRARWRFNRLIPPLSVAGRQEEGHERSARIQRQLHGQHPAGSAGSLRRRHRYHAARELETAPKSQKAPLSS